MNLPQKITVIATFLAITGPVCYVFGVPAGIATAGGLVWLDLTLERIKRP